MKYSDGEQVKLNDRVKLGGDESGIVVCIIEDDKYTDNFSKAQWGYLKEGMLVKFQNYGLIHFIKIEKGLQLIQRA